MLAAVKGIVQGNTVVIEDEDIRDYDGAEVIVTLLNYPQRKEKKGGEEGGGAGGGNGRDSRGNSCCHRVPPSVAQ